MKYLNKTQAITAANQAGSTAKTFAGAKRFLAKIKPELPLVKRGNKAARKTTKQDYKYNRRASRIMAELNLMAYDEAVALADRLTAPLINKAKKALRTLYDEGYYRQSQSAWAGGQHTIDIRLDYAPSANGWSERAWSKNGKWTGTDSYVYIKPTWQTFVLFPELTCSKYIVIDAKPTYIDSIYQVLVLEQSRGFDVKPVVKYYVPGKGLYSTIKKAIPGKGAGRE